MTNEARGITLGWPLALALVVALVGGGAATALWWTRSNPAAPTVPAAPAKPSEAPANATSAAASEARVTLTPEMSTRAGIVVEPVTVSADAGQLRIPGTVQPNAYRQVVVTPVVSGRVTSVQAALGDHVTRGQALAQLYSPELAEAQTAFAAKRAEVEAAAAQLKRTERLVEIGAASRQELEQLRAEHTRHTAELETARTRLVLVGIPTSPLERMDHATAISAVASVTAPIVGVVTARTANVGLNVDPSTPLFTLVDLSSVWIEGDVYERDFAAVAPGTLVTVTTAADPGLVIEGKVSYIDPQVRAETRTAKLRVEVPNPGGRLKLGMFADIRIAGASKVSAVAVPRSALQTVDDRQVVYVAGPGHPGQFTEREVQTGEGNGDRVQVLAGLKPGELVVTKGSFFLRAERERVAPSVPRTSAPTPQRGGVAVQSVRVDVTESGFEPSRVTVNAGQPVRITFIRRTDKTCATEVAIPSQKLTRPLPLNQPVTIDLTPSNAGEIGFTCGMNMLKGTIVVQ